MRLAYLAEIVGIWFVGVLKVTELKVTTLRFIFNILFTILFLKNFFQYHLSPVSSTPLNLGTLNHMFIDAHGLKIQGRGYGMFLPKFLGGSRVSGQIAWGVHLFWVLLLLHFY